MKPLLPRVLAVHRKDEASPPREIALELHVPSDLAYFDGHFPGLPILPGVVQLDWAAHFAREHLKITGAFLRLENVKFLAVVHPEAELTLALLHDASNSRIEFSFSGGARRYSSGRIVFGAEAAA
jgi:3-hydroxymyristoyl/3-hydroxydecanoyl-(acyl carrier protein) dehydratase